MCVKLWKIYKFVAKNVTFIETVVRYQEVIEVIVNSLSQMNYKVVHRLLLLENVDSLLPFIGSFYYHFRVCSFYCVIVKDWLSDLTLVFFYLLTNN